MLKLTNQVLRRTKSILSEAVLFGFQIYFLYPKSAKDKSHANHLQILNFEGVLCSLGQVTVQEGFNNLSIN